MNYQQIINRTKELYPHGESNATVIAHINSAQDELSMYFGKIIVDSSLLTVSEQDEYAYPSSISDVSEIKFVDIGVTETPRDRFDYNRYVYIDPESGRPNTYSYFQIYSNTGAKSLGIYPAPVTDNLPIRITYQKKLSDAVINSLSSEPEFDSRYHDLLVYYSCYMICSSGASPDAIQSDSFRSKFDDGLVELWRNKMEKSAVAPFNRKDNNTWHR